MYYRNIIQGSGKQNLQLANIPLYTQDQSYMVGKKYCAATH